MSAAEDASAPPPPQQAQPQAAPILGKRKDGRGTKIPDDQLYAGLSDADRKKAEELVQLCVEKGRWSGGVTTTKVTEPWMLAALRGWRLRSGSKRQKINKAKRRDKTKKKKQSSSEEEDEEEEAPAQAGTGDALVVAAAPLPLPAPQHIPPVSVETAMHAMAQTFLANNIVDEQARQFLYETEYLLRATATGGQPDPTNVPPIMHGSEAVYAQWAFSQYALQQQPAAVAAAPQQVAASPMRVGSLSVPSSPARAQTPSSSFAAAFAAGHQLSLSSFGGGAAADLVVPFSPLPCLDSFNLATPLVGAAMATPGIRGPSPASSPLQAQRQLTPAISPAPTDRR